MAESFQNINEIEFKEADSLLQQGKTIRAFHLYSTSNKT